MRFTNITGRPANWTMGFQRDGRELLVVIAKATYRLPALGEEPTLADQQLPLVEGDQFTGEPGLSAPLFETDFAHRKPACDVLLVGSAYAPQGRSVLRTNVAMRVGPVVKEFAVVGTRTWCKGLVGVTASDPQPFERLPLTYDCAFGGTDRTQADRGVTHTYLANPVGAGYWRHTDGIDGQRLPTTEQIGHPVDTHRGNYVPMALSPLGRSWTPRCAFAGTYDQTWIETTAPLWPDDFDERYFQAAPPEQTMPYPSGGEEVVLRNLTPDGQRAFRLPSHRVPITFIPHRGRDITRDCVIDTIVLDPDHERFSLTWRLTLPLGRSVFDVKETIVGEMSPAWHRARRAPGKRYYPSLGAVVAEVRKRNATP